MNATHCKYLKHPHTLNLKMLYVAVSTVTDRQTDRLTEYYNPAAHVCRGLTNQIDRPGILLYIVKTKVGRARQIVSSNTPIAYLVCCGRQIGGLYPPLFLQCIHVSLIFDRFLCFFGLYDMYLHSLAFSFSVLCRS